MSSGAAAVSRGEELLRALPAHERAHLAKLSDQPLDIALRGLGISKIGQRLAIVAALRAASDGTTTGVSSSDKIVSVDVSDKHSTVAPSAAAPSASSDGSLSESQCIELLGELLVAYRDPAFLSKLRALRAEVTPTVYMQTLGRLVLTVQLPLFRKFGLPPDASGVDVMKHAIHRRIAEGNPEAQRKLEGLVNEARATLGLAPLPDARSKGTAEDLMASMIATDDDPDLLDAGTREKLESASRERRISAAASAYLHEQLRAGVRLNLLRSLLSMAEVGLPTASLSGRDAAEAPSRFADVAIWTTQPTAEDFMREHVLASRPAVLRGLVTARNWAPMRDFGDFDYLRRRCGHRKVLVKSLALDDTHGRPVFVSDPELRLPLLAFLDAVEQAEAHGARCPFYLGKVPLRAELPELDEDLKRASASPVDALAGCFGTPIPQGLFTYFGCDRNVTATHFDPSENMLICLFGTKRLWLYPPSDVHHLYPVPKRDGSRAAAPAFQTYADLPERLRATFPQVAHARPIEVNLVAGDVLYLPACWWHCVEGSKGRNMIINAWYQLHPRKRMLDDVRGGLCKDEEVDAAVEAASRRSRQA